MNAKQPKRRIRQNVWGNWYGYAGARRVVEFANMPEFGAEEDANHWLATGTRLRAGTAMQNGRMNLAVGIK